MNTKNIALWTLLFLLALVVSACDQLQGINPLTEASTEIPEPAAPTATPEEPTPAGDPILSPADIESLEVLTEEQVSGQVSVRIRGVLPNNCTRIDDIISNREGSDFRLTVLAIQEPGEDCSAETVPFEETVEVDVSGLDAGSYNVIANDRQVSFELEAGEPEPEEEVVETVEAEETVEPQPLTTSVSGLVWHDSCANAAATDGELPAGCVLTADNVFLADGLLADEDGIAGVEVAIGEGECPATAVDTMLTDNQGAFTFGDLTVGPYCLFIDRTRTQNQGILGAGSWTVPASDEPEINVTLDAGDVQENINFAWDFFNLPAADNVVDLADCTNSFEFVADLTIPDDTAFAAGEAFTKEWQLRNNGTCPWSSDYSIIFVGGDPMSAEESFALDRVVAPDEDLEVSIDMIAPEEPGTYRGNWQVASVDGEPFGIDGIIEDAFWLQIVVADDVATPSPSSAVLGGVVWDDFCFNSDPGQGCVEFPEDSGIFVGDGSFGPGESPLSDILIGLADGACPTDGTFADDSALVSTTLTDGSGQYRFENLPEGTYCVFMDALDEEMVDLLIPGNWTWPGTGVGRYTFVLDPGEETLDLDFGWDYVD